MKKFNDTISLTECGHLHAQCGFRMDYKQIKALVAFLEENKDMYENKLEMATWYTTCHGDRMFMHTDSEIVCFDRSGNKRCSFDTKQGVYDCYGEIEQVGK